MFGLLKKEDPSVVNGVQIPWKSIVEKIEDNLRFTPDIPQLQRRAAWNVFLYDYHQSGQSQHENLGCNPDAKMGTCYTDETNFVVYRKNLGKESFPIGFELTKDQLYGKSSFLGTPARIQGQCWKLRPDQIIELDRDLLNTVQFERKRITVELPYKLRAKDKSGAWSPWTDTQITKFPAFIYLARPGYWLPMLNDRFYSCLTLQVSNYNDQKYYYFNEAIEGNTG